MKSKFSDFCFFPEQRTLTLTSANLCTALCAVPGISQRCSGHLWGRKTCPRAELGSEALPQVAPWGRGSRGSPQASFLQATELSHWPWALQAQLFWPAFATKHFVFGMSGVQEKVSLRCFHCLSHSEVSPGTGSVLSYTVAVMDPSSSMVVGSERVACWQVTKTT